MKHHPIHRAALGAFAALGLFGTSTLSAGVTKQMMEKSVIEPEHTGAKLNLLLAVNFADKYVTPRGMIVRDSGLTIQPLLLAFVNLYEGDGFISSFKVLGGIWMDFGTEPVSVNAPFGSNPKTHFTEVDPIFGVSFGIMKKATLDITYTAFVEQILDIPTAHNLWAKLSYDDSSLWGGSFALNPYVLFWRELQNKTTAARVPYAVFGRSPNTGSTTAPDEGYYFEFGMSPSFTFKSLGGLKVEAPCRMLLPSDDFYGDWYGSKSTVALYEVGGKVSLPLGFMPKGYGNWTANIGYRYMNFQDDNLQGMNQFNSPGKATSFIHQIYGGLSVFF